ncbi:OB-fold protein [Urbifossiella limnaea]|uniref:tRNA_anti-like protein n=1 Tax=Urbifossiella limnaea TaxID=2528023 RepID=A0A517XS85_9BACT|nr:hypothetical protein [Urbifossiella limnaea]QDU20367.1 tRNA_anti-like protein [Urbifossiella limnaea]
MNAPAPKPRRRFGWFLAALVVLAAAGGGGWLVYSNLSRPADYADPDGVFTATFPNPPAALPVITADPAFLKWGERGAKASVGRREYAVTVQDGLNPGNQEPGPAGRDAQAEMLVVMFAANTDGTPVTSRAAKHDGHVGREVVIAGRDDGRLTAVRVVVGETCAVRMTVKAPGDKAGAEAALADAAAFFDTVKLGPAFGPAIVEEPLAVSATELAAAYKADPAAADGRFKGRWVRVNGKVTDTADGAFTVDGDVAVRRAAKARMNVPARRGSPVTATGKCLGLVDGKATLAEAVVLPPPS